MLDLGGLEFLDININNTPKSLSLFKNEKLVLKLTRRALKEGERVTTRGIAKQADTSHDTVWKIWKKHSIEVSKPARKRLDDIEAHLNDNAGRVTQKKIAELLGLSPTAVSLALRGSKRVSPATEQLVLATAKQLGYEMDYSGRRLAALRWDFHPRLQNIAIINFSYNYSQHPNRLIHRGARRYAERLNYQLSEYYLSDYESVAQLFRVLINRGVVGVVVGFINFQKSDIIEEIIRLAKEYELPIVSGIWHMESITRISPNAGDLVSYCFKKILQNQYPRMALMVRRFNTPAARTFLSLQNQYLPNKGDHIPVFNDQMTESQLIEWISEYQPKVIIGRDHNYHHLVKLGYNMPEDFMFVSMEKVDNDMAIAGCDLDFAAYGELCVYHLDLKIRHLDFSNSDRIMRISLMPQWCPGDSFIEKIE